MATALDHRSAACQTGRVNVTAASTATILSTKWRASEKGGNIQLFSGPPQPMEEASTPSHPGDRVWGQMWAQRVLRAAADMSTVGAPYNWFSCAQTAGAHEKSWRSRVRDTLSAHEFATDGTPDAFRGTPTDATTMNHHSISPIKAAIRLVKQLMTCKPTRLYALRRSSLPVRDSVRPNAVRQAAATSCKLLCCSRYARAKRLVVGRRAPKCPFPLHGDASVVVTPAACCHRARPTPALV